jgi:hypothetical protein
MVMYCKKNQLALENVALLVTMFVAPRAVATAQNPGPTAIVLLSV